MAPTFDGKVIIVTGGARGIGQVYSQELAKAGARVVVSDILDGEPCAAGIRDQGGEAFFVKADVTSEESVTALAAAAHGRYGRIDGLVNNAAIFADVRYAPFDEITVAEWDQVMDVNVKGVWLAARAVYPYMKEQGSGKIVNIASGVPFKGIPVYVHYTVSKGAVVALTRTLARGTGKDGICVNAVAPGLTRSGKPAGGARRPGGRGRRAADTEPRHPPQPVSRGHRRRGDVLSLRRRQFHHRPDAAGGRRLLHALRFS